MASILTCSILVLYLNVFSAFFSTVSGKFADQSPMIITSKRTEKMTCLHFYYHDIVNGKNPTALRIAGPEQGFGATYVLDDPLTEETELTSKLVGRAQGIYARASREEANLLMVLNFVFVEGTYNGSSLSVLGHNPIFHKVREMPVLGGSGIFRFARGFALATTVLYDQSSRSAVVEYNVSVLHF